MKLLAVIVTYKMSPLESPTLRSLLQARSLSPGIATKMRILVWDNTPKCGYSGELPAGVRYSSAPHNPGLSPAYNQALKIAQDEDCDWMLTLDQDTTLPDNFLEKIAEIVDRVEDDTRVAAIVPRVVAGKKLVSPFHFALGALPRPLPGTFVGVSPNAIYAVNSAATLRVAFIQAIGGYNPLFPLDISDLDLFHRISLAGLSTYVAGDLSVVHDFSLLNKPGRMSAERYRNMLRDECAFWDLSMNAIARTERILRLAGRVCKDLFRPGTAEFQRIACKEILRRLWTGRRARNKDWRVWAERRRSLATSHRGEVEPPTEPFRGCSGSAVLP